MECLLCVRHCCRLGDRERSMMNRRQAGVVVCCAGREQCHSFLQAHQGVSTEFEAGREPGPGIDKDSRQV